MSPHKSGARFLRDIVAVAVDSRADSIIFNAQLVSYPLQVLYFIASFIVLISLCHFFFLFNQFITRKRVHDWKRRCTVSLRRVPAAVIDSFRTLAFRWTIPIGSSRELSLAEAALTLGYMAALFTWTFVNCLLYFFLLQKVPKQTLHTILATSIRGYKVDPHYYADRAGHIAATQIPILIGLGMRNNFISCKFVLFD